MVRTARGAAVQHSSDHQRLLTPRSPFITYNRLAEPAADHAVERDAVDRRRELRRDQRQLRGVQGALRDQGGQERIDASLVAALRELDALGRRLDERDL